MLFGPSKMIFNSVWWSSYMIEASYYHDIKHNENYGKLYAQFKPRVNVILMTFCTEEGLAMVSLAHCSTSWFVLPRCKVSYLQESLYNFSYDDKECDIYALAGECNANPAWMYYNCKASCGWCHSSTGIPFCLSNNNGELNLCKCNKTKMTNFRSLHRWHFRMFFFQIINESHYSET